jgi:hypothetical protein
VSRLAALQLERAAMRFDIACTRAAAADACSALQDRFRAAALGLSLARLAARIFLRRRR